MPYRHTIRGKTYDFDSLRDLLAKASPLRSGDQLAGIAAASQEQRVAARLALADLPLTEFLSSAIVPHLRAASHTPAGVPYTPQEAGPM